MPELNQGRRLVRRHVGRLVGAWDYGSSRLEVRHPRLRLGLASVTAAAVFVFASVFAFAFAFVLILVSQ
nr:hypothetical protein [Streptomyces hiroshimensis]